MSEDVKPVEAAEVTNTDAPEAPAPGVITVSTAELKKALSLVAGLMDSVNIPAKSASDWVAAGRVLADLSAFVRASEEQAQKGTSTPQ